MLERQGRGPGQYEREYPAEDAFRESFDEEGAANEAVRRADESHDRNLLPAREHGHANGRADDDDGDHRERESQRHAGDARDVAQAVQLGDPLFAVAHVVDEGERAHARRHRAHAPGVARSRLEPHVDGRRKHAVLEDVAELAQLPPRARERLLLRDDLHALDFAIAADLDRRVGHVLDGRALRDEGADLDALLDAFEGALDVDGDETE